MIGQLLALRARARWLSLGILLVYLCLLTVTTFAHQCERPDARASVVVCAADQWTGTHVSATHAARPEAQHECLACTLSRQTTSALTAPLGVCVDPPVPVCAALSPTTDPRSGISLPPPSRGPPAS